MRSSRPEQWSYIPTDSNPADQGTRWTSTTQIETSPWLQGPSRILDQRESSNDFPLADPDEDKEIKPLLVTLTTNISSLGTNLGCHRFECFSSWKRLVETILILKRLARAFHTSPRNVKLPNSVDDCKETEMFIIQQVQLEVYGEEVKCCRHKQPLPKKSPILGLDPIIDEQNNLRVGGRLNQTQLSLGYKNPIIVPGSSHIATLLVRHFHAEVEHQGRHFTEGAVRSAGLWVTGGKKLISSVIHKCVKCRKLRGKLTIQKMADLPPDRVEPCPPFTNVGLDTFGPWTVVTRRTRGSTANSKRWAILFTCLTTRAIHIEVIEEISSSAFINALKRFISIRGKVKIFRSDRGTNFVGAIDDLQMDAVNVEDGHIKQYLYSKGTEWIFNAPHSSHMGGAWERMIGVTRRILDSMMMSFNQRNLTHDVLTTFLAEVCAIINARPIVSVSSDPESPFVLSPATLLTQKTDHVTCEMKEWDLKDLYRSQWKQVQALAEMFWKRWRNEYLCTLQNRCKWKQDCPNIKQGDIVLMRDKEVHRNQWPIAQVIRVIPSADDKVRKAVLRTVRDGRVSTYTRPISEMVLLLSEDSPVQ